MRKRSILLVAFAAALVASFVVGPAATAKPKAASAGTLVFGADQEPNTLNFNLNSMYWMSIITNKIIAPGLRYNGKAEYEPYLLAGMPKIVKNKPFTTEHTYKPTAAWSDGKKVTGADFVFTWRTIMNPANNVVSREGYDQIQSVKASGQKATVVWKGTYAAWQDIVGDNVLPQHALQGQDYNNAWQDSISPASGPFRFVSWVKGQQLTIAKNPAYKSGPAAKLDRIVFRFIPNTATQFQALRAGEVQMTEPQFQLALKDFLNDPKITLQAGGGYFFEHIDVQFGSKGHPALKIPAVRKALITGMNRAQISKAIYGSVLPKPLPVLNSSHFMPFEGAYKQNYAQYKFSQQKAIDILKAAKCTGGPDKPSPRNDKIFSCPGVGKLSFKFTTTAGNQRRALTFEIIQAQLKSVGIELVASFGPATVVFSDQVLYGQNYELIMFTWLSGPTWSFTAGDTYGCGGDNNDQLYCNRKYSKLMEQAKFTVDTAKRNAIVNQAEAIMAKDVATIPLYSQPRFQLFYKNIKGPANNPTQEGVTWNAEIWALAQ